MANKMTTEERKELAKLETKLQHLRDVVGGVAKGYHTGLFIHGEGGTSKSYTVTEELKRLKCKYVYHNTRLTGRGLVDALERSPSDLHLIEDAETLLDDKKAFGVLRSALWSQSKEKPMKRPITWGAFQNQISFTFSGGIIIISNVNLAAAVAEIRALKSRVNVLGMDVSAEEIKALMKQICLDGYTYGDGFLDPDECLEVRAYVIDRLAELKRNLDLRLLINGFRDRLQWKQGDSKLHWHELLNGRMAEKTGTYLNRTSKQAEKHQLAMSIHTMKISWAEKLKLWKEKMGDAPGASQAGYDRALKWRGGGK